MKTLKEVSKAYRKELGKAIYPGVPYASYTKTGSSKAFKTGNLLTQILKSPQNNINQIGSKTEKGYKFVVDVAPSGASYGRWVHYGTRKMEARPFAAIGASSMDFRIEIDLFMIDKVDEMMDGLFEQLNTDFTKAGFKIS
jgi:hypothetical protein